MSQSVFFFFLVLFLKYVEEMVEKNPTWESLVNCNYNFREDTCSELRNIS